MNEENIQREKFPLVMRILHWLIAGGIILLVIGGFYSTRLGPDMPFVEYIPLFHRTIGTAVLGLVVLRIICRLTLKTPRMPEALPKRTRTAVHITHGVLYVLMVMIPVSGYFIANHLDHGVRMYGGRMPEFWIAHSATLAQFGKATHYLFAYGCITLVVLHVVAILWHRIVDKIDMLSFMTINCRIGRKTKAAVSRYSSAFLLPGTSVALKRVSGTEDSGWSRDHLWLEFSRTATYAPA